MVLWPPTLKVVERDHMSLRELSSLIIIEPEQPPKSKPPTLEDCQNKFKTIGWAEDDPVYEVALAILCDPNDLYREDSLFVHNALVTLRLQIVFQLLAVPVVNALKEKFVSFKICHVEKFVYLTFGVLLEDENSEADDQASLAVSSKQRLKAEKEDLEQNVKSMNTLPSFMILAPGIHAAYSVAIVAAQGQTMTNKLGDRSTKGKPTPFSCKQS
ncbi:hypothetical protein Tco_1357502 [Tanacetum coccineum]